MKNRLAHFHGYAPDGIHRVDECITSLLPNTYLMVPEAGIEPARYRYRWILSPVRLPVSPLGPIAYYI